MSRREFQFVDGSSRKFWAVEVEGTTQTVHFGKLGTTGQAQSKVFSSDSEAKKATDKLIAEKVKKGYVEVTAGAAPAAAPVPKVKKDDEKAPVEAPVPKASKTAVIEKEEPAAVPAAAAIKRTIDLKPEDLEKAAWPKKWQPLPRPEPRPFDRQQCLADLASWQTHYQGVWDCDFSDKLPRAMTPAEARFWFEALLTRWTNHGPFQAADVLAKLEQVDLSSPFTFADALRIYEVRPRSPRGNIVLPLSFLLTPKQIVELILHDPSQRCHYDSIECLLIEQFAEYVLPYVSEATLRELQDIVRPHVQPPAWSVNGHDPLWWLASHLGMSDEVRAGLAESHSFNATWDKHRAMIFRLGDPAVIEAEWRRLNQVLVEKRHPGLRLWTIDEVRHWLAVTRFSALDVVRDSILNTQSTYDRDEKGYRHISAKEQAERLAREFARVKAPEAAPCMLELKVASRGSAGARQWLDEQIRHAVVGLLPLAAGRGKLAEAAVEYLREVRVKGHEAVIREAMKGAGPELAASITQNVLGAPEKEYPPLDAASTPAALKEAFGAKAKKGKVPGWAGPFALPPILVGGKKLADDHATAVLEALQRSSLETSDPLIASLKEHAEPMSLDAFAWKLFQLWQSEGSPSKEKWAMGAVGHLGGDASALKLTPLVRNWPGESQHQRAVFGLECLRTIGTDTALMQLNGIAQKLKFKGLKQKAAEAMEAIAAAKGLTRAQLEDRVVPDCDLDERGSRVFDFGPRQFRFVLGPEMKPMIKDADGKVKTDLPKPGAKDDPAKSAESVAAWKLMKKQIKEVTAIQSLRLEQAMVTGRRWSVADFETLMVRHPLMTNLVRLILWGGYDKNGKLAATFRVTDEQTYANEKDAEFKLDGFDAVGIVHPLHLTAQQQSAWGEVFSDYEIVPPFRQLDRRVVRPEDAELKATEITRFKGIAVPAPTMVYGLEKLGWTRGTGMDGGCFDEHSKQFPASNVTAVVNYEGSVGFGYIDPNETLKYGECYFVEGLRGPSGYQPKEKRLKLGDIDRVAVSEVLTDLSALAAKGK